MIVSMSPVVVTQVTMMFNDPTVTIHKSDHNPSGFTVWFPNGTSLFIPIIHIILLYGDQVGTGPKRGICIILMGTGDPPAHIGSEGF